MKFWTKVALAPVFLVALLFILPFVAWAVIRWLVVSTAIAIGVFLVWIPRGQRFLIVYSESAQWMAYFEEEVLPRFGAKARVINLSRDGSRKKWWRLEWAAFRHCAGNRNCVPVVCRFSMFGGWETLRFYDAYMLSKKGKASDLEKAKAHLSSWMPRST